MPGRSRRRRIVFAGIIVALSIGLVFATVAYLIRPMASHATLGSPSTQNVRPGNQSYPGYSSLTIRGISGDRGFVVGVDLNGTANFCVINDPLYRPWEINTSGGFYAGQHTTPGAAFPWSSCILTQSLTRTGTLDFTPTALGNWDIITLNTNSSGIRVQFSPA